MTAGLSAASQSIQTGSSSLFSQAGTDCYMAPEVLNNAGYGKSADMWSLGCVLLELCSGVFMWELETPLASLLSEEWQQGDDSSAERHFDLFLESLLPCHVVSAATRTLIKQLVQTNPSRRPTAGSLLRSSYFTGSRRVYQFPFFWSPSLSEANSKNLRFSASEKQQGAAVGSVDGGKQEPSAGAQKIKQLTGEGKAKAECNSPVHEEGCVSGLQGRRRPALGDQDGSTCNSSFAPTESCEGAAKEAKREKLMSNGSDSSSVPVNKSLPFMGGERKEREVHTKEADRGLRSDRPHKRELGGGCTVLIKFGSHWMSLLTGSSKNLEFLGQSVSAGCLAILRVFSRCTAVPSRLTTTFTALRLPAPFTLLHNSCGMSLYNVVGREKDAVSHLNQSAGGLRNTEMAALSTCGSGATAEFGEKGMQSEKRPDEEEPVKIRRSVVHASNSERGFAFIDPCFWDVVYIRKFRGYSQDDK